MTAARPRPRLLVVQHVAYEPLCALQPILAAALDLEVLHAYADPVSYRRTVREFVKWPDYEGLVLLGGPASVYDHAEVEYLDDSIRLTRSALRAGAPILGICLGAQILAWSLDASVTAGRLQGRRKEIGWFPVTLTQRGKVDPAFHGFDESQPVFHWHGDTFALPEGAWHLASSSAYPNQAFRFGRWAYGIQFHLEVTPALVREWLSAYASELAGLDHVDAGVIAAVSEEHAPGLARKAEILGRHFVECVQTFRAEVSVG